MPEQTPEVTTLAAINALVDLYYVYSELANYVRQNDAGHSDIDLFYNRGGLKTLLHKYHAHASADPIEVSVHRLPTLAEMLPVTPISKVYGKEAVWQQIIDVRGDLKDYSNAVGAPGNQVPSEVKEVVRQVKQFILKHSQNQNGLRIVIDDTGVGVFGDADRHYALRGSRKRVVLAMRDCYPEALSAKKCARIMGKTGAIPSMTQQVSADINSINSIFKKNLGLEHDLIINRNGYLLNFEELNIVR